MNNSSRIERRRFGKLMVAGLVLALSAAMQGRHAMAAVVFKDPVSSTRGWPAADAPFVLAGCSA
jgi:hypothetical protein